MAVIAHTRACVKMDRTAPDSRTSSVRIAFSSTTAAAEEDDEDEEEDESEEEAEAVFESANGSPIIRDPDEEEDEEEAEEVGTDRCCEGADADADAGEGDEEDDEAAADCLILSTILVLSGRSRPRPTLCSNESTTEAILAAVADCVSEW